MKADEEMQMEKMHWRFEGCLWYFIHEVFIIDSSGPARPMFRRSSKNNKFLPLKLWELGGREGSGTEGGRAGGLAPQATCSPGFQKEGISWACLLKSACEGKKHSKS